jgi:hypothetical protein
VPGIICLIGISCLADPEKHGRILNLFETIAATSLYRGKRYYLVKGERKQFVVEYGVATGE